jgi:hypothetical protein
MPLLGTTKKRIGARLGSAAVRGEGVQNLICAYLAAAVLAGLLANTTLGWWRLDPAVALGIAAMAIHEGREPGKARKTGNLIPGPPEAPGLDLWFREPGHVSSPTGNLAA